MTDQGLHDTTQSQDWQGGPEDLERFTHEQSEHVYRTALRVLEDYGIPFLRAVILAEHIRTKVRE